MSGSGSDWRARAIGSFPELRDELEDEDAVFSIYILFSELLSMLEDAHRGADEGTLRRIYGYASWAREQPDDDVQNAAGVSSMSTSSTSDGCGLL